ncbi:hypothetical protein ScPMuIL_017915 [Solemya velum]
MEGEGDSICTSLCIKLGCIQKQPSHDRTIYVDNRIPPSIDAYVPEIYPNNRVVSSRYTLWNFLPKNLFEQFQRIANFYFLCVGIIQLLIDSPVSPATSIVPLVFVVAVTAIKQGYEDWLRHKTDKEVNNRPAYVLRNGSLTRIKSMNIKVGDIVQVQTNHGFPCDMVLISSHDPQGTCYVTTANLDGETNLKTHSSLTHTRSHQTAESLSSLHAVIECQQPIPDLYKFVGRMTISRDNGESAMCSLGPENVLLRGARLRNTPYVFGCAIHTGQQTKMALNSKSKTFKFSRVERSMNKFLLIFLVLLLTEASVSTGLKYWYVRQPKIGQPWYVPDIQKDLDASVSFIYFFAFLVLYNYIIPISLYVTIELQKFIGSMFFGWDGQMYDEKTNQRAKANTSDLNEELGQIEYLFTDKTGTLTENDMVFRYCSVNGAKYEEIGGMLCEVSAVGRPSEPRLKFTDKMEEFLTVLVLCHTVRVDHPDAMFGGASSMYSHSGMEYEYQASSPDEKAFVEACRRYGVVFHGTHNNHLEVTFRGEMRRFKLLHVLEFDATRKRMSMIVQNEKDEIYMLCKGAETSLLDVSITGERVTTLNHVNQYAVLGLRTLMIAHRRLTPEQFEEFDKLLTDARTSMQNREEKLEEAFRYVEKDLHLLGATAVEDKLQDDVPKTIDALREAGIKVWVLTGDKEETAVNISFSAGHFKQGMVELHLTKVTTSIDCADEIRKHTQRIEQSQGRRTQFALIVNGTSLALALKDHRTIFCELCMQCVAVLCCRMSPIQKAEVVRLIKLSKNSPVTAAIGDGANDVSMIQEAHIGLGIMGKEGRQAVRNSDYAFAKFRFLTRALLMHGHFFYIRISTLVQYFFYKNIAFITAELYYAFFSAFSEQSVYDSFCLMFYNITFTSLPILMYGIFEQHKTPNTLLENPKLYRKIARNSRLSIWNFIKWISLGLWHSFVFFFGTFFLLGDVTSPYPDGKMIGVFSFGSIIYVACIIAVNLKLCLETYFWSAFAFIGYVISGLALVSMSLVYTCIIWPNWAVNHQDYYKVFTTTFSSVTVWLSILLLIVLALLPDILLRVVHDAKYPADKRANSKYEDAFSMSFTKHSGKLTISQVNTLDN